MSAGIPDTVLDTWALEMEVGLIFNQSLIRSLMNKFSLKIDFS